MFAQRSLRLLLCVMLVLFCLGALNAAAQVTVLLPDQPTRETDPKDKLRQMDVLLALIAPFEYTALPMEMPQRVAVLRTVSTLVPESDAAPAAEADTPAQTASTEKNTGTPQPPFVVQREELLGDLEEIRYLGEKSWATHVALNKPGLYTLLAESRPRFNADRQLFEQHLVKTILPVYGQEHGWEAPAGLLFEILPQTRPFGLMAPALCSGKVLLGDSPVSNATVTAMRLNTSKRGLPSPWHEQIVTRTNSAGEFSLVCPLEGWWCIMAATIAGTPLKGPDDVSKPLELSAILWVYIDDAKNTSYKPIPAPRDKK